MDFFQVEQEKLKELERSAMERLEVLFLKLEVFFMSK